MSNPLTTNTSSGRPATGRVSMLRGRVARRSIAWLVGVFGVIAVLSACSAGPIGNDPSVRHTTRILGKRADITVSLDGGKDLLIRRNVPLKRGMSALDVLELVADVRRADDGSIVQVNGYGGGRETALGPDPSAWTYRVNGIESNVRPERFRVQPGQALWFDLRRLDIFERIPVAVGNFPQPFFSGWRDINRPVRIAYGKGFEDDARYFADTVFQQLDPDVVPMRSEGTFGSIRSNVPVPLEAVRKNRANLIIGRWEDLRLDPFILDIALDPRGYGLTTWIEGTQIRHQDPDQEFSIKLDDAEGLVWASTVDGEPDGTLVMVVTGFTADGVRAAARALHNGGMQFYLSAAVSRDGHVIDASVDAPPPDPHVDPRVEP